MNYIVNMITQIAILGVVASLVTEFIKNKSKTNGNKAKALTVLVSLVIGAVYVLIKDTPFFPVVISILAVSSTIYGFFIRS